MKNQIKDSVASEFISKFKQQCGGMFKSIKVMNSKRDVSQIWIDCKVDRTISAQKVKLYADRINNLLYSFTNINKYNYAEIRYNGAPKISKHSFLVNTSEIESILFDCIKNDGRFGIYLEDYSETIPSHDSLKVVDNPHLLSLIKDAKINR